MTPIKILRMANRLGSARVQITNQTIDDDRLDPLDSQSRYRLNLSGAAEVYTTLTGYSALSGEWRLSGLSSAYDCRFTPTIGTLTSGPVGWNNLAASSEWIVAQTIVGTKSCTGTLEIRDASTLAVLDTATIVLNATVSV